MVSKSPKKEVVKLGKIKLAFLYILIGGLAISALIAITALLIGEFNSVLQKTFGTAMLFILHSILILGLIWSDRFDEIGRKIVPTTLIAAVLANLATSTMGTWGVISGDMASKSLLFYSLLVGVSFIIGGALNLRINHRGTSILLYGTVGSTLAWMIALVPWIFDIIGRFNPFYFRVVGALTILSVTLFIVAIIIRGIALSHSEKLQAENKVSEKTRTPGGLLAYYITVGCIVSIIWFVGMINFTIDSVDSNRGYRNDLTPLTK